MFNDINLPFIILSAMASLIALTVHEYCHGYAAYRLGDDTAKNFGRLTLNPLKHIDIYGLICMAFFRIGWAKPVPINARNFKDPKKGFAITAAAEPLANLILAFVSMPIVLILYNTLIYGKFDSNFAKNIVDVTMYFFLAFHLVNVGLAIFNLIPIPPFDGSRMLYVFLSPKAYFSIMQYERKIYFIVLGWLFLGDNVASALRMIPLIANNGILYWLAGIFSLSGMIGTVINWVSIGITRFWGLIPAFNVPALLLESLFN